ncbi:uncharacterized protein EV154DRAFT_458152 [Mucor mucedo]|uniref:uncharacterized protein n=1 Tax=Mucor mucedo TaxID=29922 RepID=UPI00221F616E|nr:uncharacterized protein EV154DRAFT_458152 [Mucor mucedo]KAI7895170.1 hypothetical protein EV154DRAFT_458152 [Mucor mucedo]
MKISGYTFIVTGGASGLGESVVRSLIEQGAFVAIFDINVKLATALVEELGKNKCYFPSSVDVTVEDQVNIAVQKTLQYFSTSTLRGAILSSGIVFSPMDGYGPDKTLTSYSQFEHIIRVNLLGTYCVAQKVAQELLRNEPVNDDGERGVIITVSSILGLDGTLVGYGTSKAGIAGLTLPLAKELAPQGIRVMSIAPGPFDTPIVQRQNNTAPTCLFPSRYGQPQEFSDLVVQVIGMRMLNGSVIRLDGALKA